MSVDELRRAFLFASEVEEKIRRFRSDRLEILSNNEGPLAVGKDGDVRLLVHVVPRAAFSDRINLSLDERNGSMWPIPLGPGGGGNSMFSLDGLVSYSGHEQAIDSVRAFSTLFRNGIAEAVAKVNLRGKDGRRYIPLTGIEHDVMGGLKMILGEYKRRAIPAPYTVMVSLLGMRGVEAYIREEMHGIAYPHRSDKVVLPELLLDAATSEKPPEDFLKPLFDLLWNAFGQFGSPNYDRTGKYVRR